MKKTSLLLLIIVLTSTLAVRLPLHAQLPNSLPAFTMLLTDGKTFGTMDLPRSKPVLLIYFAPDCEHCQLLLNEFFQKIAAFKNIQVLLVTFKPVRDLVAFEKSFKTRAYPNLHVGMQKLSLYTSRVCLICKKHLSRPCMIRTKI